MPSTARKASKTPSHAPAPSLGKKIDKLQTMYEKYKALEAQVNELKNEYKDLEQEIQVTLLENGVTKASGTKATVSISKNEVPSVEDWDSFYAFIRRNNAFYLLQRRANAAPYRELLEKRRGKKIPGVSTVETVSLNRRVLS